MNTFSIITLFILTVMSFQQTTKNQQGQVGGPCEGCEAVFEYGSRTLSPTCTLPDYNSPGPRLEVTGTIFQRDGKTPAEGVILYIYHTDQKGQYPTTGREEGWGKRHGYLRGWIKTDKSGRYTIFTLKPAPYPGREAPAHIHATLKEPSLNAYWIDEFLFDDDPLLTPKERSIQRKRGGNGIHSPVQSNGRLILKRDIILGLNIPDYPAK
jgi:protocatechuate 3,4-dioxygenase beta subunit